MSETPEHVEVDGHLYVHVAACPCQPPIERSTDPIECSECGAKALPWEVDDSGRCASCAP